MDISFAPEVEAKLNRIASESGKDAGPIVQELVASHLEHEDWFRQEVKKGLVSLESGKSISHEEVRRQMEQALGS
jgi:predicted transcriptional regulator